MEDGGGGTKELKVKATKESNNNNPKFFLFNTPLPQPSSDRKVGLSCGAWFDNIFSTKHRARGNRVTDNRAAVTPGTTLPKPANLFAG